VFQKTITIDDIIAAEGEGFPPPPRPEVLSKHGFILLTAPGTIYWRQLSPDRKHQGRVGRQVCSAYGREGHEWISPPRSLYRFHHHLKGQCDRTDVTVKGSVYNTTGNETGVVLMGSWRRSTGNQFIASHVPFNRKGSNSITVRATGTALITDRQRFNITAVSVITSGSYRI